MCRRSRDLYRPYRNTGQAPSANDTFVLAPPQRNALKDLELARGHGTSCRRFRARFEGVTCNDSLTNHVVRVSLAPTFGEHLSASPAELKAERMERRPYIVVVEDEATQRQLLVDYLTRQNFRVSGIGGGAALRK